VTLFLSSGLPRCRRQGRIGSLQPQSLVFGGAHRGIVRPRLPSEQWPALENPGALAESAAKTAAQPRLSTRVPSE
jgi:hypothetical protein